jgi:hypothetical protein
VVPLLAIAVASEQIVAIFSTMALIALSLSIAFPKRVLRLELFSNKVESINDKQSAQNKEDKRERALKEDTLPFLTNYRTILMVPFPALTALSHLIFHSN